MRSYETDEILLIFIEKTTKKLKTIIVRKQLKNIQKISVKFSCRYLRLFVFELY